MTPNKLPPLPELAKKWRDDRPVDPHSDPYLLGYMRAKREAGDDLNEALRQSQSLPAGAVAYLAEAPNDVRVFHANDSESLDAYTADGYLITPLGPKHLPTLPIDVRGTWYEVPIPVQLHIIAMRDALQADAREKGEAVTALWRPIETAPKDESSILLWDEDHGAGVCLWDKELQRWIKWWHPYDGPQYAAKATHWMPLPHDPATQPAQASEPSIGGPWAACEGGLKIVKPVGAEAVASALRNAWNFGLSERHMDFAAEAAKLATHPQPVTPAGGEVELADSLDQMRAALWVLDNEPMPVDCDQVLFLAARALRKAQRSGA